METIEAVLVGYGARRPLPALKVGKFTRLHAVDDKDDAKSLFVKVFTDGNAIYGDWRTGEQHTFILEKGEGVKFDAVAAARKQAEADAAIAAEQAEVAVKAKAIWAAAKPVVSHSYLNRKGISAFAGYAKQGPNGTMVLAVRDVETGEIVNLQYIKPSRPVMSDGKAGRDKTFLTDGRLKKAGIWLGKPREAAKVVICEGFATGAAIHMATGLPVFCCLSSNNYLKVAMVIRRKLPNAEIVVGADHDKINPTTGKRVGLVKAQEASKVSGGLVITTAEEGTDFNDVLVEHGVDAVASYFSH